MSSYMVVRKAVIEDLNLLVKLFDDYRCFYQMEPDVSGARKFLEERIKKILECFFVLKLFEKVFR